MRRGQISVDFLVIVTFTFIIFLEMFQVYALESKSARIIESKASALRVGSRVARTINEVSRANGTSALIAIPESLDTGETYYLSIKASGRRVDVFWPISVENRSVGVAILTSNVSEANISKPMNSGETVLNITNLNGLVNISYCGDALCALGESCYNCVTDCGSCCPNGICDTGEDCNSCSADCGCTVPGDTCCYCPIGHYFCQPECPAGCPV